jgi:hypothetical protein
MLRPVGVTPHLRGQSISTVDYESRGYLPFALIKFPLHPSGNALPLHASAMCHSGKSARGGASGIGFLYRHPHASFRLWRTRSMPPARPELNRWRPIILSAPASALLCTPLPSAGRNKCPRANPIHRCALHVSQPLALHRPVPPPFAR